MMVQLCRVCGRPEEEHHEFDAEEMPHGCVCDSATWGKVGPICEKYVGNGRTNCERCEHDLACHVQKGDG